MAAIRTALGVLLAIGMFTPSAFVFAHEVYVLDAPAIQQDIASPSPNPFSVIPEHEYDFIFWGFLACLLVTTVFFMSISARLQRIFYPLLVRLKPWAPLVARITLGLCLIASAYNHALFGPELPLSGFGSAGPYIMGILYITGVLVLLGIGARIAAAVALIIFLISVVKFGGYMLTYANYLGEIGAVLLLGSGKFSLRAGKPAGALEPYAFLALRVGFGISVAFASFYAKFLHSNLALETISQYHLTNFFHFEPLFVVLGACIIEVLIGIFFIVGFEIRHTALFFLFWIGLSLLYFGESVWPHLILVGVNISLIMYGYDRLTLEGRLFGMPGREPVL